MGAQGNIIICDESALYAHMHADGIESVKQSGGVAGMSSRNPLDACARCSDELNSFNTQHPLYGGEPVSVLVNHAQARRSTARVRTRFCSYSLPASAFSEIRDGLYVASPELTFTGLAYSRSLAQIARAALTFAHGITCTSETESFSIGAGMPRRPGNCVRLTILFLPCAVPRKRAVR